MAQPSFLFSSAGGGGGIASASLARAQISTGTRASKVHPICSPWRRSHIACSAAVRENTSDTSDGPYDAVVIGAGIGGLCAAVLLGVYGRKVLVVESHSTSGGVAHGYERAGYVFETGPSFYCGLTDASPDRKSLNPLKMVFDAAGLQVECVPYDKFVYHFGNHNGTGKFKRVEIFGDNAKYVRSIGQAFGHNAGQQMQTFISQMNRIFEGMEGVPAATLEASPRVALRLFTKHAWSMFKLLPFVSDVQAPLGRTLARLGVKHEDVRRVIDLEAFLLSGMLADRTITAEVAFMVGERSRSLTEFPVHGTRAIIDALEQGVRKYGGEIRLNAHVEQVVLDRNGAASGVRMRRGENPVIRAPLIISNASVWDTKNLLLNENERADSKYARHVDATPAVSSFMHLHVGFDASGLSSELDGHHALVLDCSKSIEDPGNTVMVSIASVWDSGAAPAGKHVAHLYTLEEYGEWEKYVPLYPTLVARRGGSRVKLSVEQKQEMRREYDAKKRERVASLYRALREIIPDIDARVEVEQIGSPLTHERYTRRYRGSYGPAIAAPARFPGPATHVPNLYRVGDSVVPGIGVPAVAASAFLCVNSLVESSKVEALVKKLGLEQK
ncbi:Prolycopene isomerase, chloroplastic [Porphyridium purpureum]|uniref:Prolycopene isomerase, chloroplastic n=1 Tax=Porphyridium purpureum TaxID=35688 RepID=A0A5J4YZK7_PORPP|nr:Prolycopene isomerase, chloroplastic [Porphyridium purpureum]|eukprot:POR9233..scf208_2